MNVKTSDARWASLRQQMPAGRDWAYFDHAAVAPISGPAAAALQAWGDDVAANGAANWLVWSQRVEEARHAAARLIGAAAEEIALVPNTTAGISLVAEGFPWQPGDNVVAPANEFPSNLYPWMNLAQRGVEVRRVEPVGGRLDLDRLSAACDSRTRIVTASWVGYTSGWRSDPAELAAMAHSHGALLFLDAIQGLGAFPLDVKAAGVDFLAADGHKWLLGPEGAGVCYIRRELLDLLRPQNVGWHSVRHQHDFSHIELDLKPAAERFEGGSQNIAGFVALGASINLLQLAGIEAVGQRIIELTDLACQRLEEISAVIVSDRTPRNKSGIVSFDLPSRGGAAPDLMEIRRKLMGQHVLLSCRGGHLRISPHAYNTPEDIDRLIEAIRNCG